jgi:hypothetical protein
VGDAALNITILSAFRDSTAYIERYFTQIDSLACLLGQRGDCLNLVLGYGDSSDGTEAYLYEEASNRGVETLLLDVTHGGPHFGSIEHPQRFKQLAYAGNSLLGCVQRRADVVAIVESDLIWDAQTFVSLLDDLELRTNFNSAVAPMVMDGEHSFYDVFAFRRNGERFTKEPPYLPRHTRSDLIEGSLIRLDSAGSMLVMDGSMARRVCFTDEEAIVGLCKDIYAHGGTIWLDADSAVFHP